MTIQIPSRTHPDQVHIVEFEGTPEARCSCMAAMFGKACWAVQQANELCEREREQHERASAALRQWQHRPEDVSTGITHPQEKEKVVTTFKARKWDEETDGSGEFAIPDVPDGTYPSTIVDCEDREFTSEFGTSRKYMVKWHPDDMVTIDDDGEERPVTLTQFVKIPQGLIEHGYVHEKSDLYPFLKLVGVDPDASEFEVDPNQWIGKRGMIWVENKASKKKPEDIRPQVIKATSLAPKGGGQRRSTVIRSDDREVGERLNSDSPWHQLAALMQTNKLVASDIKPFLGGTFSAEALSFWLSGNPDRSIEELVEAASK